MEDFGGEDKSLASQNQTTVANCTEDVGKVDNEVKTTVENTDVKLSPKETEEIQVNVTGDKPKSFKDRKKEAIMKAESVIKQNEQMNSSDVEKSSTVTELKEDATHTEK